MLWQKTRMFHPWEPGFLASRCRITSNRGAAVIGTLNEAIASGGTLVRPAEKVFWGGFRGYFSDPDGFLWEVCYNPIFPLNEQGNVQIPE